MKENNDPEIPAWVFLCCALVTFALIIGGCQLIFSQPKYIPSTPEEVLREAPPQAAVAASERPGKP